MHHILPTVSSVFAVELRHTPTILLDGALQQVDNSGCCANHLQVGAHHTSHKEARPGSSRTEVLPTNFQSDSTIEDVGEAGRPLAA